MHSRTLTQDIGAVRSLPQWERIGMRRRSGVLVPLFSVYSSQSAGCGDFRDLRLLIDWAVEAGISIIQLLPMNEVGYVFCPYDSLSSFALEPMYLCIDDIPEDYRRPFPGRSDELRKKYPLVGRQHLDYRVKEDKLRILWEMYSRRDPAGDARFEDFVSANRYWLDDFTMFKVLKDLHEGKAWEDWDLQLRARAPGALDAFRASHERQLRFYQWVQWRLFEQFSSVKRYAEERKVLLKGDLPILVSRDSADVWAHQDYFKLDFAAGAPPDMYSAKGQRWGTPPYNWKKIWDDDFRYFQEKLTYAGNFYDLFRIDHVVGLLRIWSIPYADDAKNQGLHGVFDPPEESRWASHGTEILARMIENSRMLLCAEDLGTVPPVCKDILRDMGIPGNDVQRWVKDWHHTHDFLAPEHYRLMSVAMLSTHDTTNWAAWWVYEAGTVDEGLFSRKCAEAHIDFASVRDALFDPALSRMGRLRWRRDIDSVDQFTSVMRRSSRDIWALVDMYVNTWGEKEKLWSRLGMEGPVQEDWSTDLLERALRVTQGARSIFAVESIIDLLFLGGAFAGDPYQYRINTPGTISGKNWSLLMPLSIERLREHPMTSLVKEIAGSCGRI